MADESLYLSTYEAALAIVATAMKKSRLSIDTLIVNSFLGGILFSSGGMLCISFQANCPELTKSNPGLVHLFMGFAYPMALFYVVIMGVDLFNSNILFFSVGLARGAINVIDLLISWIVSWFFNLVGNIFVCYVIFKYSGLGVQSEFVDATLDLFTVKTEPPFIEMFLRGVAANFFVCLAIYLQLMAKPLHVKFFLMFMPVFTFVLIGFDHSVADMFIIIMGLISGGPVPVSKLAWRTFFAGALGNIVGGSFFGLAIPWYLHIFVVEKDIKLLKLPRFMLRDEQPELNQDSRVVRVKRSDGDSVSEDEDEERDGIEDEDEDEAEAGYNLTKTQLDNDHDSETQDDFIDERLDTFDRIKKNNNGVRPRTNSSLSNLSIPTSRLSLGSKYNELNRSSSRNRTSPRNVFPVYGMGKPLRRERTIAGEPRKRGKSIEQSNTFNNETNLDPLESQPPEAETIGGRLTKVFSRRSTNKSKEGDLESRGSISRKASHASISSKFKHNSRRDLDGYLRRMSDAGISEKAINGASEVAGSAIIAPPPAATIHSRNVSIHEANHNHESPRTRVVSDDSSVSMYSLAPYQPDKD